MNIVSPNQEESVVKRWLKKLIQANKEREENFRKYKERAEKRAARKPKPRKPKTKEKAKREPVVVREEPKKVPQEKKKAIKNWGFVYLMRSGNGYHKIGITQNIKNRLYGIRVEFPVRIDIVHYIASEDYRNVERLLHNKYSDKRVQHEWFNLNEEDVRWFKSLRDHDLDPLC